MNKIIIYTYPRATPADIDRMWARLWGEVPYLYVQMQYGEAKARGSELLDLCEGLQINQLRQHRRESKR